MPNQSYSSFPVRERGLKPAHMENFFCVTVVVPRAGTWIETSGAVYRPSAINVVPRAGTWIETSKINVSTLTNVSVVPRAGTWIETLTCVSHSSMIRVVPRAGTWIETEN